MSDHKCTAEAWAKAIAKVIKQANADGWTVGIGEDGYGERYVLSVYTYADLTNCAEVEW